MQVAYFVNQYPMVSHSFIRREIQALELQGCEVARFALRSDPQTLVEEHDKQELAKTRFVLKQSIPTILKAVFTQLRSNPTAFLKALKLMFKVGWRSEAGLIRHFIYFVEACLISEWLKETNSQHVHAHFGTNSTAVVMLASELTGIPYSFTAHGPEEFDKPGGISLSEKITRSAFVVAISSFGKSQLSRWVDHDLWDKLKIVHCGLDQGFHEGKIPAIKAAPRLVCVGRLCEQKAQPLLIEAAHNLKQQGRDFELVLAGDGPLRSKIESMIEKYDLKSQVRITGWISSSEVRDELIKARTMVLPSFAEGLPVVIMEAMALGRPVISTYVAGIPELVIPGENGWLVPAGDIDALTTAIGEVLDAKPAQLKKLGANARSRVLERHDIDTEAAKLVVLFEASIAQNATHA